MHRRSWIHGVRAVAVAAAAATAIAGCGHGRPADRDSAVRDVVLPTPGVTITPDDGTSRESGEDDELLCRPGRTGVVYGTAGNDTLTGTAGHDVICGLGGDDTLVGGPGKDVLVGGDGSDSLVGGGGSDLGFGGRGADTFLGGDGHDVAFGDLGADTLTGGRGRDGLTGGAGDDTLTGGDGDDRLFGGPGADALDGQDGDDSLFGDPGVDTAEGRDGTDTCIDDERQRNCERGLEALDPFAVPVPIDDIVADPTEFTIDDVFPGLVIHLVTGGGISSWDVQVQVARDYMVGPLGDKMPGGAWEISGPEDAAPLRSGSTLTLPYDPERLDGFPERDLRIFVFDQDAEQWRPASLDGQTVDTTSHTVTSPISRLSDYAVLMAHD